MGLVPLEDRPQRDASPLPTCEDTAKAQPSMNQEVSPHKTQNLLASLSWTFTLLNYEKSVSVVYKIPSLR